MDHLAFMTSQSAYIEPQVYRHQYPMIQYPQLIPVDTMASEWAGSIEHYVMDGSGQAVVMATHGTDVPLVSMTKDQLQVAIIDIALGYGYTIQELGLAQLLNENLTTDKAMYAREIVEKFLEEIFLTGYEPLGWKGLVNHDLPTVTNAPATFAASTAQAILELIQGALIDVYSDSLEVEMADTIALPTDQYALLASKPLGDDVNKTIDTFLRQNNVYTSQTGRPLMIRSCRRLAGAGAAGSDRMIVYRRDPTVLKAHLPMPYRFYPVREKGAFAFEVPGLCRTGGFDLRRPDAVRYYDGV